MREELRRAFKAVEGVPTPVFIRGPQTDADVLAAACRAEERISPGQGPSELAGALAGLTEVVCDWLMQTRVPGMFEVFHELVLELDPARDGELFFETVRIYIAGVRELIED